MPEFSVLAPFVLACVVICAVPGPDHAFIAVTALSRGARAGLAAAAGMAAGMCVHLLVTVLGLSVLLQHTTWGLNAIRIVGAAYLVWLGVEAIRDARREDGPPQVAPSAMLRKAVLTNLTNPKIILFMVAFLPQFTRPDAGPVPLQLSILGLILIVIGLLIDAVVGVIFGRLGHRAGSARARRMMTYASAVVYLGLAALLVVDLF